MCPLVQSDGNKIHPGLWSQQGPRPVLLSFIIVLCSQVIGEVLPLGAIIFVLLVEQFIELFLVQLYWDYLDAGEQVQFKKPSRLLRYGDF